jgi:hypothetical protein
MEDDALRRALFGLPDRLSYSMDKVAAVATDPLSASAGAGATRAHIGPPLLTRAGAAVLVSDVMRPGDPMADGTSPPDVELDPLRWPESTLLRDLSAFKDGAVKALLVDVELASAGRRARVDPLVDRALGQLEALALGHSAQ